jgi:putative membrane protein
VGLRLVTTEPARRRYWTALFLGVITGCICAIVKFGWEVPFPPRTPDRNVTNPPQQMLEQLGFSDDFVHTTYTFNGNQCPIVSFIAHFGFSIAFAALYCLIAERNPQIKLWQGVAYGLFIWILWHLILMPALNTTPAPWNEPFAEHFSEATGHAAWMWVMCSKIGTRRVRSPWFTRLGPDLLRGQPGVDVT